MSVAVALADPEQVVQARLLGVLDAPTVVVRDLDSDDTRRPAVVIAHIGGVPVVENAVSRPMLSFEVYSGDDRAGGRSVAEQVRAALVTSRWGGSWSAAGAVVTSGRTVADPIHHVDPNTGEHRHAGTVQLTMRHVGA